VACDQVTL